MASENKVLFINDTFHDKMYFKNIITISIEEFITMQRNSFSDEMTGQYLAATLAHYGATQVKLSIQQNGKSVTTFFHATVKVEFYCNNPEQLKKIHAGIPGNLIDSRKPNHHVVLTSRDEITRHIEKKLQEALPKYQFTVLPSGSIRLIGTELDNIDFNREKFGLDIMAKFQYLVISDMKKFVAALNTVSISEEKRQPLTPRQEHALTELRDLRLKLRREAKKYNFVGQDGYDDANAGEQALRKNEKLEYLEFLIQSRAPSFKEKVAQANQQFEPELKVIYAGFFSRLDKLVTREMDAETSRQKLAPKK